MDEAIRLENNWCSEGHPRPMLCVVLSGPVGIDCLLDFIERAPEVVEYRRAKEREAAEEGSS